MKHILFMDPLEKLSIKKDSTLMLALTMKKAGVDVSLLFEQDFFFDNTFQKSLKVYDFSGEFLEGGPYLSNFELTTSKQMELDADCTIHMRLDPPFDTRYLRYLWMLKALTSKFGCRVMNSPEGIMLHNEKLYAYQSKAALESFVGSSVEEFLTFSNTLKEKGHEFLILKPLDLYQGIGVEKVSLDQIDGDLKKIFLTMVDEFGGALVVQPFDKKVEQGEIRSIYFKGVELGSILKTPPEGQFLANIAQGATYERVELTDSVKNACNDMAEELMGHGVDWIAYDILGDNIQEVNITCPGLLVEVSKAMGKNLAQDIIEKL